MNKVWLLVHYPLGDSTEIFGIFTSSEKAEKAKEKLLSARWRCEYDNTIRGPIPADEKATIEELDCDKLIMDDMDWNRANFLGFIGGRLDE